MSKNRDFKDKRVTKKEKRLLKKNRKEVDKALKQHELGWETRDGKRL